MTDALASPQPLEDGDVHRPRRFTPAWSTLALVLGIALAVASLAVEPPKQSEIVQLAPRGAADPGSADPAEPSDPSDPADAAGAASPEQAGQPGRTGTRTVAQSGGTKGGEAAVAGDVAAAAAGAACAPGKNGGATDTGVSGSTIKLGSTIVQSGIGASFLGDVRFAMETVVNKTNAAGGICGRRISLKLVDDGWQYQRGGDYLRNLVEDEKVFALAVVPSSEGLKNVSEAGYLKDKQIPVIGTDGMLIHQYTDPYIWPVASSTVSTMHIMVKQAHDAGAREFGLVYENNYHFGIEGAFAFNAAVRRLTGNDIKGYVNPLKDPSQCKERFCGISSEQDAYASQIQVFNSSCSTCQFIGLLLEPTTATKWMKGGGKPPGGGTRMGGVQPLFTYEFGNQCQASCHELWLWTGYTPPIGDFLSRPAVATYVNDIKGASSSADYNNQFVLGGYIGMQLVVKALQAAGPRLTREGIKTALDSMTFDSGGLAPVMSWSAGNHFANVRMSAYSMQYKGGFNGWRDEQTALADPWVGQDGG